jgi:hypothetical protein
MKTLTMILAASATAGTVAAGGAAIALTGSDSGAPTAPAGATVPRPNVSTPQVPVDVDPTNCVQLPAGNVPAQLRTAAGRQSLNAAELERLKTRLAAEWSRLPVAQATALPANGAQSVRSADPAAVRAAVDSAVARLRAGVPACVPSVPSTPGAASDVPASVPSTLPTDIPQLPAFSCSDVAPVVSAGSTVERQITAQTGLTFVSRKTRTITVKGQKVCVTTQRWTGGLGQWMEVERIKGEVNVQQVRQTLRLPSAETVTLGRDVYWRSPLAGMPGSGLMWTQAPGVVDYVSGGLTLQPRLQQIATTLHEAN